MTAPATSTPSPDMHTGSTTNRTPRAPLRAHQRTTRRVYDRTLLHEITRRMIPAVVITQVAEPAGSRASRRTTARIYVLHVGPSTGPGMCLTVEHEDLSNRFLEPGGPHGTSRVVNVTVDLIGATGTRDQDLSEHHQPRTRAGARALSAPLADALHALTGAA